MYINVWYLSLHIPTVSPCKECSMPRRITYYLTEQAPVDGKLLMEKKTHKGITFVQQLFCNIITDFDNIPGRHVFWRGL